MWRTVIVSKGERLTVKNNWLYVYSDEFEHHIPIDDIYALVIDNHSAMLSVNVLSSLSSAGAHIYYCGRNHLPVAVTYTLNSFYKPLLTAKKQMSMTKEQKDNLWNLIVRQKIINQSLCLNYCGVDKQSSSEIKSLALNIVDGDKTNREAVAAKKYVLRVKSILPEEGSVRVLTVTDKQYDSIEILLGKKTEGENFLDNREVIEL